MREAFVAPLQARLARTLTLWVGSYTPNLSAKATCYGLFVDTPGQVAIWDFPGGNTEYTLTVLQR